MKSGVYTISGDDYRKADGVSKSMLDELCPPKTPAHFAAKHITGDVKEEETDVLRFGSLLHRVILEPDTLADAFYVEPEELEIEESRLAKLKSAKALRPARDGKVAVAWSGSFKEADDWKTAHSDRMILHRREAREIEAMRDAVWSHPTARRLLTGAETERSLFAFDNHETLRKCRLDALIKGNIIPDLKTCRSASADDFEKAILDHGYHRQAAYYIALCNLIGIEKSRFAFICVEKTAPFCVAVYDLDPAVIEAGRLENERNLALYRQCIETNRWPGYSDNFESIGLPSWAMKQLEGIAA